MSVLGDMMAEGFEVLHSLGGVSATFDLDTYDQRTEQPAELGAKVVMLREFGPAITGEIITVSQLVFNQDYQVTHPQFVQEDGNTFFSQPARATFGRGDWWEVIVYGNVIDCIEGEQTEIAEVIMGGIEESVTGVLVAKKEQFVDGLPQVGDLFDLNGKSFRVVQYREETASPLSTIAYDTA